MSFGHWEIILVVLAIILLFGSKKIPELMRGLGSGVKEFKKGIKEGQNEDKKDNKSKKDDFSDLSDKHFYFENSRQLTSDGER